MSGLQQGRIDGIYVVTDGRAGPGRDHVAIAAAAVAGGACIIQLREKDVPDRQLLEIACAILSLTQEAGALFIINNRPDIALACAADGVHVGQDDLPIGSVRKILGPDAIIGASTANAEEAARAEAEGASYVAVSPVFSTMTKEDAGEGVGLEVITQIRRAVSIPVAAIGGISLANIASVAAAGADSAAVVSAVTGAPDMKEAVRALAAEFARGRKEKESGFREREDGPEAISSPKS